jgi:dTDP-4-amino-4,6-dideoxygalactose transaminase
VATLNAIIAAGATACFADISASDFNVDAQAMAAAITPRTKVLLPVHLYGQCADMEPISAIASDRGMHLIEDAAQAHGARVGERVAGSWGIGCFSLYATKNITSAEGGLISTNDDAIADRLRVLRNQGMRQRYQYEMAGNNYRLTDLQAAVCVPQLCTYEANVAARQRNAAALSEGLAAVPGVVTPAALPGRHHVWHQYTILIEDGARLSRDEVIDGLVAAGIGCGIYYPKLVFDYECYRGHPQVIADSFPVASDVVRRCLSLPVHQYLTDAEVDRIVSTVSALMGG